MLTQYSTGSKSRVIKLVQYHFNLCNKFNSRSRNYKILTSQLLSYESQLKVTTLNTFPIFRKAERAYF